MTGQRKEAQDDLVREHLHLVSQVVNQMAMRFPRHVDRGELWNAGAFGLVDASRRFNPQVGTPFAHYAASRIRGAIIDSTRSRDWVSRGARRRMRELREGREQFIAKHGREPEQTELAELLGVSTRELESTQAATTQATVLQLDQRVGAADGEDLTLGDLVQEQDRAILPEADFERREMVGAVRVAIARLPEIQREVVERYYFEGEQLRDIAETFDLTDARISQLRNEAMVSVRAYLAGLFEEVDPVDEHTPGTRRRTAYLRSMQDVSWRDHLDASDRPEVGPVLAAA